MTVRLETKAGHYTRALPNLDSGDRMLTDVWTLTAPGPNGTCLDVEAVCVAVIGEQVRRWRMELAGKIDRKEALAFLLGEAVVLHRLYDPAKRHGSGSFSGYLYDRLRFRLIDYWRSIHGKNGERGRREILTDFASHDDEQDDGTPGERGRLLDVARASVVDREDAVGRLHAAGDRVGDGAVVGVGVDARQRPTVGLAGSAAGTGGSRAERRKGGAGRSPFRDCGSCGWRQYAQAPNGQPGWHMTDVCDACGETL